MRWYSRGVGTRIGPRSTQEGDHHQTIDWRQHVVYLWVFKMYALKMKVQTACATSLPAHKKTEA